MSAAMSGLNSKAALPGDMQQHELITRAIDGLPPEAEMPRRLVEVVVRIETRRALEESARAMEAVIRRYDRAAVDYAWHVLIDEIDSHVSLEPLRQALGTRNISYPHTDALIAALQRALF